MVKIENEDNNSIDMEEISSEVECVESTCASWVGGTCQRESERLEMENALNNARKDIQILKDIIVNMAYEKYRSN